MKKLAFLAILLTISVIGFGQPAYMEPVVKVVDGGVPRYIVNDKYRRIPVKHFASDSVFTFKLIDYVRNTEVHSNFNGKTEKKYKYIMFFEQVGVQKPFGFKIESYDKIPLLSALNNDSHYFYTDGKQLFVAKKENLKKKWYQILFGWFS